MDAEKIGEQSSAGASNMLTFSKDGGKKRKHLLAALRKELRNAHSRETDDEMSDDDMCDTTTKNSKIMQGNKIAKKQFRAIEIGWMHEGQQVRRQTGGGTKKISISKDATVREISEEATKLFFPDGESKRGIQLQDVGFEICDFSLLKCNPTQTVGEAYQKEKLCGIMRYYLSTKLKDTSKTSDDRSKSQATSTAKQKPKRGTSPSGTSPTHRTGSATKLEAGQSSKEHSQVPSSGLYVVANGEVSFSSQPLQIHYYKDIVSSCHEVTCRLTANSSKDCIGADSDANSDDPDVPTDPLENGYVVGGLSKGDVCFLWRIESDCGKVKTYEFPDRANAKSPDPHLIMHHPNEVWGYEDEKLVIGVVSPNHNHDGVSFEWFRNNNRVYSGGCILVLIEPGDYHCQVKAITEELDGSNLQEISRESNVVQVVRVTAPQFTELKKKSSAEEPEEDNSPAQKLNVADLSIDLTQTISQGSFGEVFRGKLKGTCVAVKRIKLKQRKRPDKLILKEAAVHKRIKHQNIVKFMGTAMDESHVYIVTELIDGQNMEDVIYAPEIAVTEAKKVSIAVDVLKGVKYLHEHTPQIIHQDIKPANILVDKVKLSAKLCDLGLAKVRSSDVASTTSGVHAAGTPEYMSPESLLGNEKANVYTDMWSVGITLMEWFSCTDAWDLQNQEEEPLVFIRQCMQKLEAPPVVTKCKLSLLRSCVSYHPPNRPTARQLLKLFQCPSCSKGII